ncbi:hypothetical protein HYALB_00001893 [Hymenoscyphus albidus]|uniref:L-type lectin-like domain-containing protein n=1 Tax=Hymenoscyphus albidus TaxID=595503 RepID=A0A9N9LGA4_9HELO|nr:hypothetical protein HYALB_00001893 [Hymenoscyphus albidus]
MVFSPSSLALASALFLASAQATYLSNELSFGHNGKISPNARVIPHWAIIGKPDPPSILSNKVVLTPPVPGNQRGAVWADSALAHSQWTVDVDFRATGPERGGGNMNIWYAHKGKDVVATSSIYTVGKFDGLALVVDQYAGSGGFIRGFLNDGSTDYKSHHSVDSLAFGHCTYPFRNLGRPSRITIRQTDKSFKVSVDGNPCFESAKVKLPLGNYFGMTAASAENPDSFEVFKFVTTTDNHASDSAGGQKQAEKPATGKPAPKQDRGKQSSASPLYFEDTPASQYTSSEAQFADLHNRLQAMMKHISTINRDFNEYQTEATRRADEAGRRHDALLSKLLSLESLLKSQPDPSNSLKDISSDVRSTKAELHNLLQQHAAGIKLAVRDTHDNMKLSLENSGHSLLKFFGVVMGAQVIVGGAYVMYKRRKAGGVKKYL